jgi:hypothetical protein
MEWCSIVEERLELYDLNLNKGNVEKDRNLMGLEDIAPAKVITSTSFYFSAPKPLS